MKKALLISLVISIFLISGSNLVFGTNSNQIDIESIQDFDSLTYPKKCLVSSDCDDGFGTNECLKCKNATFVFLENIIPNVDQPNQPKPKMLFTKTESDYGLCTRAGYDEYTLIDFFYKNSFQGFVYCLADFQGQVIPTTDSLETIRYLPLWKEKLMLSTGMSEEYFKDNFYIQSTYVKSRGEGGELIFWVNYYFKGLWSDKLFQDKTYIRYDREYMQTEDKNDYLDDKTIQDGFKINFKKIINKILSKEEAQDILKNKCSPGMVVGDTDIDKEGRMVASGWDIINEKENKCKVGAVNLENGELIYCQESPCRAYMSNLKPSGEESVISYPQEEPKPVEKRPASILEKIISWFTRLFR